MSSSVPVLGRDARSLLVSFCGAATIIPLSFVKTTGSVEFMVIHTQIQI